MSKYIVLDTETTGLHPCKHGLIQFAAIALDEHLEIQDTICLDINPGDEIEVSQEALKINGFTDERIKKGVSYSKFCHLFNDFCEKNFEDRPVAVGQFYPFDYAVLEVVFSKCKLEEKILQKWLTNDFLDTKVIANYINLRETINNRPKPFVSTSLSKPEGLRKILEINPELGIHDALGDVLATREVLLKLLKFDLV